MDYLNHEIKRQIAILTIKMGEEGHVRKRPDGFVTLPDQPTEFCTALKALHAQISLPVTIQEEANNRRTASMPDLSLLWKVPAFCEPTPYMIGTEWMINLSENIQKTREARAILKGNECSIWFNRSLASWVSANESRLLCIKGRYQDIQMLDSFGLELSQLLNEHCHTVLMLPASMSVENDEVFKDIQPEQVVRQLAIQVLRKITAPTSISLFATVVERFSVARSLDEWLGVFKFIISFVPCVHVVVNLRIFGIRVDASGRLLDALHSMLPNVQPSNTPGRLKIIAIITHQLALPEGKFVTPIYTTSATRHPRGSHSSSIKKVLAAKLISESALQEPIRVDLKDSENNPTSGKTIEPRNQKSQHTPQIERRSVNDKLSVPSHGANETSPTASSYTTSLGQATAHSYHQTLGPPPSTLTASSTSKNLHRQTVTVAIICALTIEVDAIEPFFDEFWDENAIENIAGLGDTNAYTLGRIGRHHVALVHLAGMGKSYAAIAAAHCKSSFPSIAVALLVGICGGVPSMSENEVSEMLLGDVVISEGVVMFDYGRQYPDIFLRKDSLLDTVGRPPTVIRAFLAKLKGRRHRKELSEKILHYLGVLEEALGDLAIYPGANEDCLYESVYRHKHSSGCSICDRNIDSVCDVARTSSCDDIKCDRGRLVARTRLKGAASYVPRVHFGLVASGDQVMKSGEHRDAIALRENIIAFEMEAAGAWENFSCVIIKGVCDYADSHKSKKWQTYAAATAASCAKVFLDKWTFQA